ncbi:MAG TPA: anti-sigma factor [Ornithinibacter sp.]|nr:anti-sigma factor [Ornithinibacter sp.]
MSPDLHHLSGAYAVDALDEAERESFEQHLAVCADCRAEVAELSATAHHLSSLSEATPPPALRASVLHGITRVRPLPPLVEDAAGVGATSQPPVASTDPAGGPAAPAEPVAVETTTGADPGSGGSGGTVVPFVRRTSTWLLAAAAAVAIAVGGLAWGPWSDPASPVDQVVSAADATRVSSTTGSMTAEVAYSRQLGKGAITVTGLPAAPDGKTYQLWYVGADGVARSAGLLDAGANGTASMVLEGDPNTAAAVGMTVEPVGGSPSPTTDPLVVLALA